MMLIQPISLFNGYNFHGRITFFLFFKFPSIGVLIFKVCIQSKILFFIHSDNFFHFIAALVHLNLIINMVGFRCTILPFVFHLSYFLFLCSHFLPFSGLIDCLYIFKKQFKNITFLSSGLHCFSQYHWKFVSLFT